MAGRGGDAMLTLAEAAKYVGVPEAQLVRWAGFGVGPAYQGHPLVPKGMRYQRSDLDEWRDSKLTRAQEARN